MTPKLDAERITEFSGSYVSEICKSDIVEVIYNNFETYGMFTLFNSGKLVIIRERKNEYRDRMNPLEPETVDTSIREVFDGEEIPACFAVYRPAINEAGKYPEFPLNNGSSRLLALVYNFVYYPPTILRTASGNPTFRKIMDKKGLEFFRIVNESLRLVRTQDDFGNEMGEDRIDYVLQRYLEVQDSGFP